MMSEYLKKAKNALGRLGTDVASDAYVAAYKIHGFMIAIIEHLENQEKDKKSNEVDRFIERWCLETSYQLTLRLIDECFKEADIHTYLEIEGESSWLVIEVLFSSECSAADIAGSYNSFVEQWVDEVGTDERNKINVIYSCRNNPSVIVSTREGFKDVKNG
jgi:hypothetical protein